MAWTLPTTFVDGVVVAAADLNLQVRDNLRYLKGLDGVPYLENAIELPELATPSTPAAGRARLWPATSGLLYGIDDAANTYALGQFRARVFNNAAISIPNNAITALTFNSQRTNVGSLHATGTNPGRLTAPVAGAYLIGGHVAFASNTTGIRAVYLRINGSTQIALQSGLPLTGGNATIFSLSALWQLAASDYAELLVYQNSGAALDVSLVASYSPEFWMLGPF